MDTREPNGGTSGSGTEQDRGVSRARREGVSRRRFLAIAGAGGGAVLVAGASVAGYEIGTSSRPSIATFPATRLASLSDLKVGQVSHANYPDEHSPVMIFKLGKSVPDGVGPDGDVVAYSSICTHLGCTVVWRADTKVLSCPCHFSSFDPARGGIMIVGQATTNLPQVILKVENGNLVATGMRGLIWGRQTNLQALRQEAGG